MAQELFLSSQDLRDPYREEAYARCHEEQGAPFYLPQWDTWLLRRPIPGQNREDATGFYPACRLGAQAHLKAGLEALSQQGMVSLSLVTDAFQDSTSLLREASVHRIFKTHYLVDLQEPAPLQFSRHHTYEIRRSPCEGAVISFKDYLGEWMDLYTHLGERHHLSQGGQLSAKYFERLTEVPQLVAVGGFLEKKLVSMHVWIHDGTHVFSHVAASDPVGYDTGAAYVVNKTALHFFASHPQFSFQAIDLGGCVGPKDDPTQGLARFKKGFSNHTAPVYLCGYVLDREAYHRLSPSPSPASDYFPAYRAL
jgi:hypothetical protein